MTGTAFHVWRTLRRLILTASLLREKQTNKTIFQRRELEPRKVQWQWLRHLATKWRNQNLYHRQPRSLLRSLNYHFYLSVRTSYHRIIGFRAQRHLKELLTIKYTDKWAEKPREVSNLPWATQQRRVEQTSSQFIVKIIGITSGKGFIVISGSFAGNFLPINLWAPRSSNLFGFFLLFIPSCQRSSVIMQWQMLCKEADALAVPMSSFTGPYPCPRPRVGQTPRCHLGEPSIEHPTSDSWQLVSHWDKMELLFSLTSPFLYPLWQWVSAPNPWVGAQEN